MSFLSQRELQELEAKGFSEEEIKRAEAQIEREDLQQGFRTGNMNSGFDAQHSSFSTKPDDNIIKWQLELNDILERAEYILKGDVPTFNNG